MLKRREFITLVSSGAVGWALAARAQERARIARIGWLALGSPETLEYRNVFEHGLRDLGYIEGRNLTIEYRWANFKPELLAGLAAELVSLKVDVILSGSSAGTIAAANATTTIPIVFVGIVSPDDKGLIVNLARPGRNLTGLTSSVSSLISSKRLELLKEMVPSISRVAFLTQSSANLIPPSLQDTAENIGLKFEPAAGGDIESALLEVVRQRPDAIFITDGGLFAFRHRKRIADFAIKYRLPTMFPTREGVAAGGLASYGADVKDLFRRAPTFVSKLLNGAKAAELPVEQPIKFELVISLKAASALGITIPEALVVRANELFE